MRPFKKVACVRKTSATPASMTTADPDARTLRAQPNNAEHISDIALARDDLYAIVYRRLSAGNTLMLRVLKALLVIVTVMTSLSQAMAFDWICRRDEACFPGDYGPGYPIGRAHKFHPRLRDGLPLVTDFKDAPSGYHGAGCVWTRERVVTRKGVVVWAMVPFCLEY